MTLGEFEAVMAGVALRNGHKPDGDAPSLEEYYDDLALSYRAAAGVTRH